MVHTLNKLFGLFLLGWLCFYCIENHIIYLPFNQLSLDYTLCSKLIIFKYLMSWKVFHLRYSLKCRYTLKWLMLRMMTRGRNSADAVQFWHSNPEFLTLGHESVNNIQKFCESENIVWKENLHGLLVRKITMELISIYL